MKKLVAQVALFGILAFGYHHILHPVAKGAGKVLHAAYHVIV